MTGPSGVQRTLTANTGILDFVVPLPAGGQPGTLTFILRSLTASPELPPYAASLNVETWDSVGWTP